MTGLFLAVGVIVVLLVIFVVTMLLLGAALAFATRDFSDEAESVVPSPHRPIWRQP